MSGESVAGAPIRIVIVGAGPAGIMILERIIAGQKRDAAGVPLEITLVDPHEPGGGRIWRRSQSPLLKLNTMLRDSAVFTDESCRIAGPIAPGPTLAQWIEAVRSGEIARPGWWDERLEAEITAADEASFPTRRLNSAYLAWAYAEICRRARPEVSVRWHCATVTAVNPVERGSHTLMLDSGEHIRAEFVVHAHGHSGSDASPEAKRISEFAVRHGLEYVPPSFTADLDFSWLRPGEDVIVRGMGLAAVDLVVLLTEGRGGAFSRDASGRLRYAPSGQEPVLHLGSRRGVPYRSKVTSQLVGDAVQLEYLGADFHRAVAERNEPWDFDRDIWPLVAAELVTGYYSELSTGHPERVRGDWEEFRAELREVCVAPDGNRSRQLAALIAARVPDPLDWFDLDSFDRPLDELPEQTMAGVRVHDVVREHIARDLALRTSQRHSATQALFLTALHSYLSLAEVPQDRWSAKSLTRSLPKRWHHFFSYLASGPPGHRLEELIALADAGIVHFLGGNLALETDDHTRLFRAVGGAGARASAEVAARVLIDAWLPEAVASASDNPLVRQLVSSGQASELVAVDAAFQGSTGQLVVDANSRLPHAGRQFAHGPFTSVATGGAFARPGMNSLPFRLHDRVAQAVLSEVAELASHRREESCRVIGPESQPRHHVSAAFRG